jgi:predicted RNA binding protein YcfA (HicA-like mRNA interferase family)
MKDIENIVKHMEGNPKDVRFTDLCKVCEHYFGKARTKGSHCTYRTPWQGNPRVNIQDNHGKCKAYQVRQVLEAINKLRN